MSTAAMDRFHSQSPNHLVLLGNDWPSVPFSFPDESPTNVSSSSTVSTAEVTAGNDGSSFLSRNVDDSLDMHSKYWICVGNLSAQTTDSELKKLFYPYGGDEAFTVLDADNALVGYVGFEVSEMASIAAEKMDAFIPCRQTHALMVRRVTLEEVLLARSRPSHDLGKRPPLSLLLLGSSPEQAVATAILRRLSDPAQCAIEVVNEVGRATPSSLRTILTSLLTVSVQAADGNGPRFFDELLKELLRCLLDAREPSFTNSANNGALAATAHAVVNSGAVLGNLFALHILPGDPFIFASRLLQRTGAVNVAQVNGICAIAHACHAMPFPISKASFWALVGHTATEACTPQLCDTLLTHLRQLKVVPQVPPMELFSTQPPLPFFMNTNAVGMPSPLSPLTPATTGSAAIARTVPLNDARQRTVHVSHLPPQLTQRELMDLLRRGGIVNKVRLCIGNGYSTIFAFVEMQTADDAREVTRLLNNRNMMGVCIRVQPARSPIQDVVDEDAAYSRTGAALKPCTFGISNASLMSCAAAVQAAEKN